MGFIIYNQLLYFSVEEGILKRPKLSTILFWKFVIRSIFSRYILLLTQCLLNRKKEIFILSVKTRGAEDGLKHE